MKGIKTFRLFIANGCLLLKTFLMRLAIVLIFLSVPILLLNCSVSDFAEFIDKSVNAFSLLIEEMSGGKVYSVDGFAEVLRKAVFTVYDLFDSLFVNVPELFSKPVVIYVGIAVFYVLYRFFDGLWSSGVYGFRKTIVVPLGNLQELREVCVLSVSVYIRDAGLGLIRVFRDSGSILVGFRRAEACGTDYYGGYGFDMLFVQNESVFVLGGRKNLFGGGCSHKFPQFA